MREMERFDVGMMRMMETNFEAKDPMTEGGMSCLTCRSA